MPLAFRLPPYGGGRGERPNYYYEQANGDADKALDELFEALSK